VKLAILAAVILALFLTWRFTPLADLITAEHVMAFARTVGRSKWSPVVLALAYIPANFVMFPRPLLTLFAVIAFGPWIGFAVVGMVAGAARMKWWQFLLGITIGMLPGTLATTLFADQIANALHDLGEVNYWIVGGVILVFVALFFVVRAWMRRHMSDA
jgi:uncharacterized membrane protein YdjX (TVP38/TMEM64 family)